MRERSLGRGKRGDLIYMPYLKCDSVTNERKGNLVSITVINHYDETIQRAVTGEYHFFAYPEDLWIAEKGLTLVKILSVVPDKAGSRAKVRTIEDGVKEIYVPNEEIIAEDFRL